MDQFKKLFRIYSISYYHGYISLEDLFNLCQVDYWIRAEDNAPELSKLVLEFHDNPDTREVTLDKIIKLL